jgi:hypothetical protein
LKKTQSKATKVIIEEKANLTIKKKEIQEYERRIK